MHHRIERTVLLLGAEDADEEERQTVAHKRFVDTQWMGFKVLIALGFGLTALANIAVMWVL